MESEQKLLTEIQRLRLLVKNAFFEGVNAGAYCPLDEIKTIQNSQWPRSSVYTALTNLPQPKKSPPYNLNLILRNCE